MLFNYLKISIRHLWKNKIYSSINITGLSAGITVCMLILLFVSHEYSFDKFHKNIDNIYLKLTKITWDGRTIQLFSVPEFAPLLKENSPEVINYCRMISISGKVMKSDFEHKFVEDLVLFADSSFFSMFSFDLIKGNTKSLSRPNTIVLSEETAKKYFGDIDPIGKSIYFDKDNLFEVVGIAAKAPSNSSIQFNCVASMESLGSMLAYKGGYLGNPAYQTYFLLHENVDVQALENSITKAQNADINEQHILEPFSATHFSNTSGGSSNSQYVFIFLCIALFVLVLALINYMNLTTARAAARVKEVGVRKIAGASRNSLFIQFYLESIITTIISFVIAAVLVQILTPIFLNILQQPIDSSFFLNTSFLITISILFFICVFLSGSYPALVLPRFKVVESLKGSLSTGIQGAGIRNIFTIFQFSVSLGLVICSLVVYNQLHFMQNKKIGMEKDQILVIPLDGSANKDYSSFKNELRQQSGVKQVASASVSLFKDGYNMAGLQTPTTSENVMVNIFTIDENFLETLGMEWKIKPTSSIAAGNYLINEAAIYKLKVAEQPIGQQLAIHNGERLVTNEIVGVIKDFNYASLRSEVDALVIMVESDTARILKDGGSLYVRLNNSTSLPQKISSFRKIYEKYQPEIPFEYFFLDDLFNKMYKSEERLANIFSAFTVVAISIACLGLFGLVSFVTEKRTKEVGIRKILGASPKSIVILLSKKFLLLVLIALIIASPITYFVMSSWLTNFAYHIAISWEVFVISTSLLVAIALVTISFQTIKSALANPVSSLRSE
jgi:putative ABC transport system permease protein